MDRNEQMKLMMALVVVVLMFLSATFTMPQLEGNVVEPLVEDVADDSEEQISGGVERVTEDQSEQSAKKFLSLILAEQENRDEVLSKINQYKDALLEAFETAVKSLES